AIARFGEGLRCDCANARLDPRRQPARREEARLNGDAEFTGLRVTANDGIGHGRMRGLLKRSLRQSGSYQRETSKQAPRSGKQAILSLGAKTPNSGKICPALPVAKQLFPALR